MDVRATVSCNATMIADGGHVYEITAQHCAKTIWADRRYAYSERDDVAVFCVRREFDRETARERETKPYPLPTIYDGKISGRLVVLNGIGFDPAGNIVKKVYFSYAFPKGGNKYWMFLPSKESARLFRSGGIGFLAKGLSGTGIADAKTGKIVGVASGVTLLDSGKGTFVSPVSSQLWPCPNGCFTILLFPGVEHIRMLLAESRSLAVGNCRPQ